MKTVTVPEQLLVDLLDNVDLLAMFGQTTDTIDEQVARLNRLLGRDEPEAAPEPDAPMADVVYLMWAD